MRTRIALIGLMGMVCGCNVKTEPAKVKWQYKVVEKENYYHTEEVKLLRSGRDEDWKEIKIHDGMSGTFYLDSSDLTDLGLRGWEMTGCFTELETKSGANVRSGKLVMIFKRPWPSEKELKLESELDKLDRDYKRDHPPKD